MQHILTDEEYQEYMQLKENANRFIRATDYIPPLPGMITVYYGIRSVIDTDEEVKYTITTATIRENK